MRTPCVAVCAGLFLGLSLFPPVVVAQDNRASILPAPLVRVCARLRSRRARPDAAGPQDTARIQRSLRRCLPGQAVELSASGSDHAFLSGPLVLPRATTLFIDHGVTLFASTNPRDYDLHPGSCGVVTAPLPAPVDDPSHGCKPFLLSYQAAYSAVLGEGTIDGQGGEPLAPGASSWWGLQQRARASGRIASVPELIVENESNDFTLAGVHLVDAPRDAAFIVKGTGFTAWAAHVRHAAGYGFNLVSDRQVTITRCVFHSRGRDIHLRADRFIFAAARLSLGGNQLGSPHGIWIDHSGTGRIEQVSLASPAPPGSWSFHLAPVDRTAGTRRLLLVAPDGSGDFRAVQAALNALPPDGGTILLRPGVYREVVTVRKPNVRFIGTGTSPSQVEIVYGNSAGASGGTFNSATVFVEAHNFFARNLTIANDYDPLVHPHEGGQAVALAVTADRAVFRHLRLLGRQDTLFLNSRFCESDTGPCRATRQYFADSYIQGNVDFIFGDSRAVFDHCLLHGLAGNVMYTAQDQRYPSEPSGFVFNHCRFTAAPGAKDVTLGRPWRRYATVVYLHCRLDAPIIPAGWREWPHDGQPSLPTAFYAEFDSTGPGANPSARERWSHPLTRQQARRFRAQTFLAGNDGWNPARTRPTARNKERTTK